ncbi:putative glycoside hydrolase [Bacillus sp. EB106-08-02-XG196]|uniref:putative glycoside hydrolase n=1 Tax=Bacillus sp. EB106-08-02-XG196 TaxID=2737049 RepID=UPI0015C45D1E|nr:putative glycoside hydrolase [Bacillus sp. EB106-08-02-XG196]NWQ41129.1 putative glycoside hydrolase [Bacillus sp. EB106-08-02-XG196]
MRKLLLTLFVILLTCSPPFHEIVLASKPFPEPIRGIYVNAPNTNKPIFNQLLSLVNSTDLNAMVIDIKDDHGNLTFIPSKKSPYYTIGRPYIPNPSSLMNTLKKNNIYPIARIVVFKDNVLANKNSNLTYKTTNGIWKNARGDSFTNPFLKEVWDYNIGIAMEAVRIGFKEIQFDYVRFPEKFEKVENQLIYDKSAFKGNRVAAVSEFVRYAKEKLKPYNVKVSVDVFGNATVIPEAAGIGQNFTNIAQNVDVISAMIYPSHWTAIFGIQKPDLQPYHLVEGYAKVENERLKKLNNPPISRPWLQDFTASWLGNGNYKVYGKKEVEDQIRALHTQGINEYLLWNATNNYTPNVDYTPY